MTELMKDIRSQAGELAKSLAYTISDGRRALEEAADWVRATRDVYIAGIGSSWHAGMAAHAIFHEAGRPAVLLDASEMVHFAKLPKGAVVIALSRSGKSIEIVKILDQARNAGAKIVGITNTPESPLAARADVTLLLNSAFDHNVSVTMYSALALVGGLLAEASTSSLDDAKTGAIAAAIEASGGMLDDWVGAIQGSAWFAKDAPVYFLARGASLASCHETRLLWEEAAKAPASAMSTGAFRHGPQEILAPGLHVGLWIDPERMRDEDLALAADFAAHDVQVMVIGRDVPSDAGELVLPVPETLPRWQFLVDIVPGQIASEHLASVRGVDCDSFRYCSYIVETEGGLEKHT